ncbi:hypothetical protein DFH09DRAFT_1089914 [Mycena vulgaris]|nr:hypothetical protein DFH09DRAFT_1089914 [Mycena vulgaris]
MARVVRDSKLIDPWKFALLEALLLFLLMVAGLFCGAPDCRTSVGSDAALTRHQRECSAYLNFLQTAIAPRSAPATRGPQLKSAAARMRSAPPKRSSNLQQRKARTPRELFSKLMRRSSFFCLRSQNGRFAHPEEFNRGSKQRDMPDLPMGCKVIKSANGGRARRLQVKRSQQSILHVTIGHSRSRVFFPVRNAVELRKVTKDTVTVKWCPEERKRWATTLIG